jgi:hypothetical protein
MNLNMNKKAISTPLVLIIIVIIAVAVVAVAFSLGSGPSTSNSDVTVYIDSVVQTGNYSEPQSLVWGTIAAGNTYTKNFTVANTGNTAYNLMLLTGEPAGTTQSWAFNNTVLAPLTPSQGTLTLTLSTVPSAGAYTWRLLATNSSIPEVTPTPNPSASPTPNGLSYTINAQTGTQNLTITVNTKPPFTLLFNELPQTYTFTAGDNLKFEVGTDQYFLFNGWQFSDGTMPNMNNPLIMTNIQGNFSLTAKAITVQP